VVGLSVGEGQNTAVRIAIAVVAALVIIGAVVVSKRRSVVVGGASADTPTSLTTSVP
jgi:K(+)-stimulated pyrophosphate-energized sodium pump